MHTALPRGQHLEVLWAQYAKNFLLKQTNKEAGTLYFHKFSMIQMTSVSGKPLP